MAYFEFPHTRTYDSDLGWLIKTVTEIAQNYGSISEWMDQHKEEYAELEDKVDGIIGSLVDIIIPWDSSIAYRIFSIVEYQGVNYMAIRDVPVGAMITDTNYWTPANTVVEQMNAMSVVVSNLDKAFWFRMPESYGAKGDGVTDDTQAFKDMLANGNVYAALTAGKTYIVSDYLILKDNTIIDLNGATIKTSYRHLFYNFDPDETYFVYNAHGNITVKNGTIEGGSFSMIHGHDITIDNVYWLNCENDHIIEVCACRDVITRNCTLEGTKNTYQSATEYFNIDPCYRDNFPWFTDEDNPTYDGTINQNIIIEDNIFKAGSGNYNRNPRAIGCHSAGEAESNYHNNIIIKNNQIYYMTDEAIRIADMENVLIEGNYIEWQYASERTPISIGRLHCKNVTVNNNVTRQTDGTANGYALIIRPNGCTNLTITNFTSCYLAQKYYHRMYINAQTNTENLTFGTIDKDLFDDAVSTGQASYNTIIAPAKINHIYIGAGRVAAGNYNEFSIRSYLSRCFVTGEVYYIPYIKRDGTYAPFKITITDTGFDMPETPPENPELRYIGCYKT